MDRLFFPAGADAMDVDPALLHDVKPFAAIAFAKKVIAFVEMLRNDEGRDRSNIAGRQPDEELTTPQRIFYYKLLKLAGLEGHSGKFIALLTDRRAKIYSSSLKKSFGTRAQAQIAAAIIQIKAA